MWSPKQKKNGRSSRFYENMRMVAPDDIVFSFYKQHLQKIGIALSVARAENRPLEFRKAGMAWAPNGWLVRVAWATLPARIHPASHIAKLRPHLPVKYSPLHSNTGKGQQRYLVHVPAPLAAALFELVGCKALMISMR